MCLGFYLKNIFFLICIVFSYDICIMEEIFQDSILIKYKKNFDIAPFFVFLVIVKKLDINILYLYPPMLQIVFVYTMCIHMQKQHDIRMKLLTNSNAQMIIHSLMISGLNKICRLCPNLIYNLSINFKRICSAIFSLCQRQDTFLFSYVRKMKNELFPRLGNQQLL